MLGVLHVSAVKQAQAAVCGARHENIWIVRVEADVVDCSVVSRKLYFKRLLVKIPHAYQSVKGRRRYNIQRKRAPVERRDWRVAPLIGAQNPCRRHTVLIIFQDYFEYSETIR